MAGCKKYKYWFFIVITAIFSGNELWAQQHWQLSRDAIDSLVHPKMLEMDKEVLTFNVRSIDLGNINEMDTSRVATFYFENSFNDTIRITDIKTSCGCTQVQFPKSAISHGGKGCIKLTFDPIGQAGTIDTYAYVYTNLSKINPIVRLGLTGNVLSLEDDWSHLSHKMGVLRLKRKEITFREVENGNRTSLSILCGNSGETPLKLTAANLPSYLGFKTIPAVIEGNSEADLVFILYIDKLPDNLKNNLSNEIILHGIEASLTERTIKINIKMNSNNNKNRNNENNL